MTKPKLLTAAAVVLAIFAAIALYAGVAASRRAAIKKFELAVSQSDEIRIDWIGRKRYVRKADGLASLKNAISTQPLVPEWNYKRRLVHASIFLLRDGHQLAAIHYWGDGLISIDSQLLRLKNDPFPRFRPMESPQQDKNVAE